MFLTWLENKKTMRFELTGAFLRPVGEVQAMIMKRAYNWQEGKMEK